MSLSLSLSRIILFHAVVFLVTLAPFASAELRGSHELTVNLAGGNGIAFSGDAYESTTASLDLVGFGPLEDAITFDLFATTPDDILVIEYTLDVRSGSIYQDVTSRHPYAVPPTQNNYRAPPPQFYDRWPHLAVDSWVSLPGNGSVCAQLAGRCPGFENVGPVTHFDSSDEGAQAEFNFARLTMVPDEHGEFAVEFRGVMYVADQPLPLAEPFHFSIAGVVPEPNSSGLLLAALLGGIVFIRKH